ncbi:hypothetical protein NX059_004148 [Plenodomus lindquistii]|nr:hypothetical protein NX059_004148 [Plenodomus lindquistii]
MIQRHPRESSTLLETHEKAVPAPMDPPVNNDTVFCTYDSVAEGLVDDQEADRLLEEFKVAFMQSLPFMLVEKDASALRHRQPFLFLAIMAVIAYRVPHVQCTLEDEMRRQVALVIEHSQKGLGILQGLLVYGAWYTSFCHLATQQIAIIVQLCVAFVQDLGLSRRLKQSRTENLLDGQRAFLGAYFLNIP